MGGIHGGVLLAEQSRAQGAEARTAAYSATVGFRFPTPVSTGSGSKGMSHLYSSLNREPLAGSESHFLIYVNSRAKSQQVKIIAQ